MAFIHSPKTVTDGLVLCLDAANIKSYSASSTTWKDLTNNQTSITLLNGPTFSFTNNGGIVFDGIDDYSNPSINHSYLSSSALEVIFNSVSHGSGKKTIFGYRHNSGYSQPTIGSIYLDVNTLSTSVITTTQTYRTATFSTPIQTNTTYHVVMNKDTTNGTLQLFVNGTAGTVQTFDSASYAQWDTIGNFIGANILDIAKSTNTSAGQGWAADYFNGTIFKLAVYNRILTRNEVLQNFNATRGRYGI